MEQLIEEVRKKKELNSLNSDFVKSIVSKIAKGKNLDKKKYRKEVVKESRKILREIYGAFKLRKFNKLTKYIDEISSIADRETHDKILSLHRSTKERLPYYNEIYTKIFAKVGKIKSVLDLGCGLNPFSFPYMKFKNNSSVKYYATEIAEQDVNLIQKYFDKLNIKGKAMTLDLISIPSLPKADVCFMFKLLDTLESQKKNLSKELIRSLNVHWLVVSFPTLSLGGRTKIRKNRLNWFRKIIKTYDFEEFEVENELFFIIKMK